MARPRKSTLETMEDAFHDMDADVQARLLERLKLVHRLRVRDGRKADQPQAVQESLKSAEGERSPMI